MEKSLNEQGNSSSYDSECWAQKTINKDALPFLDTKEIHEKFHKY